MRNVLLVILLFSGGLAYGQERNVRVYDSLKLALDDNGRPLYFFRNIYTPVCNTGECKPVYINFFWDLLGNYTRFTMPANEVLTKTDHREFQEKDYAKLQEIIAKETSIFSELKMEDLVVKGTEKISDSVDVKTGATLKTIKNEVIEGAVFTCYTLWHLAHGKTTDEIRSITETLADASLLHSFLQSNNHHYQYWAMDKVINAKGHVTAAYEADIVRIIEGNNIFTARYALQKANSSFFAGRQLWLWETADKAVYPLQMAIYKKMAGLVLTDAVALKVAKALTTGNQEQVKSKLEILAAQPALSQTVKRQLGPFAKDIQQMEHKKHSN
ncbi:hypothetical protein GFS24_22800 [Chitinophaga sp. SYP-B3965]|uniref:hypothetical protein n=1 Tax=Chitinophaga sp. SYP-B3965 TaxID=2663120 RepID=UPI001299C626|nr:hypothetical protein [Chitinophaga sp. SYP-B3965]MRG47968.1 hypothetical protein [Chitinophaga sp. SYP-B3965]